VENLVLVNHTDEVTRVAMVEDGTLSEVYIETASERRIVGNVYLGRVMRVLPGMNACFVDAGLERTGFLYAYDVIQPRSIEEVPHEEEEPEEGGNPEAVAAPQQEERRERERPDVHIETLLSEGQEVMVQVAKEPIGSKGARLTCNISLPGVLVVLMPTMDHVGISRRIDDPEERHRLKALGEKARPPGTGVIMRTVAEGRSAAEIENEINFLYQLWLQIKQGADALDPPTLLHEDMSLLLRAARELICRQFDKLVVDSEAGAREIENFVRRFLPGAASRIEHYSGQRPIFEHYGVEFEIARAVQRKVWLRSGGYLVIERTEAFTSIDVNSGRYTGKSDPEETILKTNLEASVEIAYQLRLRNIGGIIVIDFIDMKDLENRQLVQETLTTELKKDHARTRVLPMSDLGLVEMTRKRTTESIVTKLTEPCFYCEGKGYLKSPEMICHSLYAKIMKEMAWSKTRQVHAHANPTIVEKLMEDYHAGLERMERRYRKSLVLTERENFHIEQFEVFGET
jgi:ribonuclease G